MAIVQPPQQPHSPQPMPMKLLSITLSGFKSFAKKTELRISDGLTGVFGANGSGKSALFDALIWGLGGELSEDKEKALIFSGTDASPGSQEAEVLLRFTRPEGSTIERPYLEISRRIKIGEASTYRVDGHAVRNQDVKALIQKAGFQINSPTLLRGGMIEDLGTAPASQHMRILELSSGIDGLLTRRREAKNRLDSAITRLRELDSAGAALSEEIEHIQIGAENAQRHATLSRRIHGLNLQLQWHVWGKAQRDTHGARMQVKAISAHVDSNNNLREKLRSDLDQTRKQVERAQNKLDAARNELSGLHLKRAESVGEENRLQSLTEHMEAHIACLEQQTYHNKQTLNSLYTVEWPDLGKNHSAEHTLPNPGSIDEKSAEQAIHEARQRNTKARKSLEKAMSALTATLYDKDGIKREHERLSVLEIERQNLKKTEMKSQTLAVAQQKREQAQTDLTAANNTVRNARQTREQKANELKDVRAQYERVVERVHTLHSQVHGYCAELAVIESLLPSASPELKVASNPSSDAPHRLVDLIQADPRLDRALRAALGPEIHASVNMRETEHWSGKTGAVGLYLPDEVKPLNELIQGPDWLNRRLSQCGLIKAENGPRLQSQLQQGQCLISIEGDMWRWDGLVRLAKDNEGKDLESPNKSLQIRYAQCEQRLLDTRDKLRAESETEKTLLAQISSLENKLHQAATAEDQAYAQLQTANNALLPIEQELERAKQFDQTVQKNRDFIDKLAATCQSAIVDLSTNRLKAAEGDEQTASLEAKAKTTLIEAQKLLRRAQNHETSVIVSIERARERVKLASLLASRDKQGIAQLNSVREGIKALHKTIQQDNEQCAQLLSEAQKQHAATKAEYDRVIEHISNLDRLTAQAGETVQKSERELDSLTTQCLAQEDKIITELASNIGNADMQKAEFQLEKALTQEEHVEKAVQAEFSTNMEGLEALVRALPAEIDNPFELNQNNLDEGHALLQQLIDERQALGKVDEDVQNQLSQLEDKLQILVAERSELSPAIDQVRESLDFLSQSIHKRLLERFEPVQSQFSSLFSALFGGGTGQLHLVGSADDADELSLEIRVAPPGRKMLRLENLSRGERTLTMLAFVFAFFLSRPSPLCVLDQVDQTLDPAYQDRFLRLLRGLSHNTRARMMLISHNTALMSQLDQSYSVAMEQAGISTLRKLAGPNASSSKIAAA